MKKMKMVFVVIVGSILAWSNLPYHHNNEKAATYASRHVARGSYSMCAWYVIKAMWRGGCPIGLPVLCTRTLSFMY